MENKEMNDTLGKNGLVSFQLVFGILSLLSTIKNASPKQEDGLEAFKVAQAELNSISGEQRKHTELYKSIPSTADRTYNRGGKNRLFKREEGMLHMYSCL